MPASFRQFSVYKTGFKSTTLLGFWRIGLYVIMNSLWFSKNLWQMLIHYKFTSTGCSLCRLIRRPEHLIGRHCGISRQTEDHSFGDHLISESVSVTPSSVIEASVVLSSVSLWLVWVNVQSACALNVRYIARDSTYSHEYQNKVVI
jgi:hypothetical protein